MYLKRSHTNWISSCKSSKGSKKAQSFYFPKEIDGSSVETDSEGLRIQEDALPNVSESFFLMSEKNKCSN